MKDMWFLHPHLDYLPSISHHTLPLAERKRVDITTTLS